MELEPRQRIFRAIRESPGIHFRELQRALDMPIGQLDYHLKAMCDDRVVHAREDRYYKRYYAGEVDARDRELMSVLRQENPRKLVMHVMLNPGIGHGRLAEEFRMAPSTLSFYLGDMVAKGILVRERDGRTSSFKVAEPERVTRVLITYRQGFLDKLVDRFISVWFAREQGPSTQASEAAEGASSGDAIPIQSQPEKDKPAEDVK